jgi:hypothetical protein
MKRTVLRPEGPAIAATTALPPRTFRRSADNRITLAVLEQHPAGRARGYDPYNASPSPLDVQAWKRKQKPG